MCGHYSVEWYTHGTLLLGATHLSLIIITSGYVLKEKLKDLYGLEAWDLIGVVNWFVT